MRGRARAPGLKATPMLGQGFMGECALGRRGAEGPRVARAPHGACRGVAAVAPSWVTTALLTSLAGVFASPPRYYERCVIDVRWARLCAGATWRSRAAVGVDSGL